MVYTDAVQVAAMYIPKQVPLPGVVGPWFVQRRVMAGGFGKGDQVTELAASQLAINSSGVAVSPAPGFAFPLPIAAKLLYLEYRLGHLVLVLDKTKKGKNGLPVFKRVAQYLDETVSVPVLADLCQLPTTPITYRPLPCEFEAVQLNIYGKNGTVLATVGPTDTTPLTIPNDQAFKVLGPDYYYKAEWTVRRIHEPNYSPKAGYLVTFGITTSDSGKEADTNGKPLAQQPLPGPVGTLYTIPVEIRRGNSTMHLLLLENDVTKLKFNPEQRAAKRAEARLRLNWP